MTSGPALFSRFAYPPNALGYCGPADVTLVADILSAGETEGAELRNAISAFAGAWPYLELIGGCVHRDPLDADVVAAYWLGGPLLDGIDTLTWGNSVEERFRSRAGWDWKQISAAIAGGGVPTHAFHVFSIYPWVGLLQAGAADQALEVLQGCRIRWGQVVERSNGTALVRSQPLAWDGRQLYLGPERVEQVDSPIDPSLAELAPGDTVAMHWNYICQQITQAQARALRRSHDTHLALANQSPLRVEAGSQTLFD